MSIVPDGFEVSGRLWLLLLIPAVIALYLVLSRLRNRRGMRYTNTSMLEAVIGKQSQWRRHLAVAFSLLSLITLTVAFARPVDQIDVPRPRSTIVVVIDVSQSMAATDVEPTRLEAAQSAAKEFVTTLPAEYNVSIVSLSGSPAVIIPPTTDRNAAVRAIDSLKLQDGTALGEALVTALRALQQAPKDANDPEAVAPGAVVMLSDGENTAGRAPAQGAQELADAKVPVYTIAFGTENGYVDLDGKREPVPPDPAVLAAISEKTGGQTYRAASAGDLKGVYEKVKVETGTEKATRQVTSRYAGFGLGFAVLAALAAISMAVRWP